jgi:membrane protein involved in colicin uptake
MKRCMVAVLLFGIGCASSETAPGTGEPARPAPAADPKEAQLGALRTRLADKRVELRQVETDLAKVDAEREKLAGEPASNEKTNRLVELARIESNLKQARTSLNADVASLQQQIAQASGQRTSSGAGDDPLAAALEASEKKDKEEAERRRQREDAARTEEAAKIAAAERARKAELEARAREKVEGGRAAAGGEDGPLFEERWADVIIKLRQELQKYKRW